MRIIHVTLRYPPASGGVEDYAKNLVERLRASGDDVTVETTALRTHHPATFLTETTSDPPYVRRHSVRTLGRIAYPIPRSLASALEARRPDIIHAHGLWYAPADVAARVARRRHIPFVLNPYYAPRRKLLWKVYQAVIGHRTIALADAVVVISPSEEASLRAAGLPLRRVELIPPGIDPQEFAPARANPFVAPGLGGKRILFFAGRLARAKGIDLLLRALPAILRAAPDAHAVLAGEDFGERTELEALTEQLGISRAVTWLGKIPREELLAAYQHAAVFVFPSRYEAFGIAPLEAQAAGCPVVATNTASLPFVVQHGETGLLFRPEDPEDLARCVLRVLHHAPHAARLAAAGRARACHVFTWERSVRKLRALYHDLARSPRPPRALPAYLHR